MASPISRGIGGAALFLAGNLLGWNLPKSQAGHIEEPEKFEHSIGLLDRRATTSAINSFTAETVKSPIRVIEYPNFKILYSTTHRIPLSVHELITVQNIQGSASRSNKFFEEPKIEPQFRAREQHYKHTQAFKRFHLSRGHMAPAGDYNSSQKDKDDTFTYANIVPQNSQNNEDTWVTFETYQRELTNKCDSVEIISGPVFQAQLLDPSEPIENLKMPSYQMTHLVIGNNGISVPTNLYKIIKCNKSRQSYAAAFYFRNGSSFDNDKQLKSFEVPIKDIQLKTGLKFNFDSKSLVDFDGSTLSLKKKDYDSNHLYPAILAAKNYDDITNELRKVNQHRLKPPPQIYTKVGLLANSKIEGIINQPNPVCQKLITLAAFRNELRISRYFQELNRSTINQFNKEQLTQCKDPVKLVTLSDRLKREQKYDQDYADLFVKLQQHIGTLG